MAYIISSDDIKAALPGYNPALAAAFHARSTELADAALEKALHIRPEKTVILMSGGSASGKSEYVSAYLQQRKVIVSDGTFSSLARAEGKIQKTLAAGKRLEIHAVWPADFQTAFDAFIGRERQFDASHFYRTHSDSRSTLLKVAEKYPKIPIILVISDYESASGSMKMIFEDIEARTREELVEFIAQNQYTEEEIEASSKRQ